MQRTLVQNLITGVTEGFSKKLLITGVGYRAASQGKVLKLQLGYSHDVNFDIPEGIEIKTPDQTTVEISGIDKQKVGQVAAEIRRARDCTPCARIKAALSPNAVQGVHESLGVLGAVLIGGRVRVADRQPHEPVRIHLDAGNGAQEVRDAAAGRGGRARAHDGGAAAQLDRVAFRAHRERVQPQRTAPDSHGARADGRVREGYLPEVRLLPRVADLERVRAGAGADGEAAGGIGDRRGHEVTAGAVAVKEPHDGPAQRRAFRAGGANVGRVGDDPHRVLLHHDDLPRVRRGHAGR